MSSTNWVIYLILAELFFDIVLFLSKSGLKSNINLKVIISCFRGLNTPSNSQKP
jgi:hypothetical protein